MSPAQQTLAVNLAISTAQHPSKIFTMTCHSRRCFSRGLINILRHQIWVVPSFGWNMPKLQRWPAKFWDDVIIFLAGFEHDVMFLYGLQSVNWACCGFWQTIHKCFKLLNICYKCFEFALWLSVYVKNTLLYFQMHTYVAKQLTSTLRLNTSCISIILDVTMLE